MVTTSQLSQSGRSERTVVVKDARKGIYKKITLSECGKKLEGGILVGDTLLALQGQAVVSLADFYRRLSALGPAGSPLTLSIRRQGQVRQIELVTGDRNRSFRRPSGI